jgi:REP element-mobilizing transposase RayT
MFGHIANNEMVLNDIGKIANEYLLGIPQKYEQTHLHEFVVMPNHIHAIIEITHTPIVGTIHESSKNIPDTNVGAIHESPLRNDKLRQISEQAIRESPIQEIPLRDERRKMLLSKIVGWYKMNTAKQINIIRHTEGRPLWQRSYYDHIIRNEKSYQNIAGYIFNNPRNWKEDKFYIS